MPKLKTNKGAKKRFRVTATGKLKKQKAGLRHLLTSKSKKRKRALGASSYVDKTNEKPVKRLLPYI